MERFYLNLRCFVRLYGSLISWQDKEEFTSVTEQEEVGTKRKVKAVWLLISVEIVHMWNVVNEKEENGKLKLVQYNFSSKFQGDSNCTNLTLRRFFDRLLNLNLQCFDVPPESYMNFTLVFIYFVVWQLIDIFL